MNLDDAIKHCEEVARQQMARADALDEIPLFGMDENDGKQIEACYKCAEEHMQLAEWLRDYKRLKEQELSVSENPNNCEMRDATLEERESIDKYIKSISKPTGVKFGALEQEPSGDCISRQAVLDGLASIAKAKAKSDAQKSLMGRVMFFTERLPSVKPQTGHWIRITNGGAMKQIYLCSVCHRQIEDDGIEALITIKYPYCHCGARMEVEQNG